ncbi:unnamed protein product, partial [Durusdinium trenchii]
MLGECPQKVAVGWQTLPRFAACNPAYFGKAARRSQCFVKLMLVPVLTKHLLQTCGLQRLERMRLRAVRVEMAIRPQCDSWGCNCQKGDCNATQDLATLRQLVVWSRKHGWNPPELYRAPSPGGYRTRAKLAVGPSEGQAIIGLFRKGTFQVARCQGCRANHPVLDAGLEALEEALEMLPKVRPFDHTEPASTEPALRHIELTVERPTGLIQLVLLWNGERGSFAPGLEDLLEHLWPSHQTSSNKWHSILVHWREPDPSLQREMRSKSKHAWEQKRPKTRGGIVRATVLETLDGLPFEFGAKSFQQANLVVYEQILRDMKAQMQIALATLQAKPPLRLPELCGGVGVIGLSPAHAASGEVTLLSTDVNPESGELFQLNASRLFGDQELVCTTFAALSAAAALQQGVESLGGPAEVLILDPPRRGLGCRSWRSGLPAGQEEVEQIRHSSVRVIIYMSCGPRSFMQDADRLTSPGATPAFQLTWLRCYDMFPFTDHLETLGIFARQE